MDTAAEKHFSASRSLEHFVFNTGNCILRFCEILLTATFFWYDILKMVWIYPPAIISKGTEKFKTKSVIYWLMGTILKSVTSKMERSRNFSYTQNSDF